MNEFFHWVTRVELFFILVGFSYVLIVSIRGVRRINRQEKRKIKRRREQTTYRRIMEIKNEIGNYLWIIGIFGFLLFMIIGILITFVKEAIK